MQGLVLRLRRSVNSSVRWRGPEFARLTPEVSQQVNDLLVEAGGLAPLFLRTDPSPWTGGVAIDGAAVQAALELVHRMHTESLPGGLASIHATTQAGLKRAGTLSELAPMADLLDGVERISLSYSPDLYRQDLQSIQQDLAPGREGGLAAAWAFCTNGDYRRARTSVLATRSGKAPSKELFADVAAALEVLKRWTAVSDGQSVPTRIEDSTKHVAALRRLSRDGELLSEILPSQRIGQLSPDELISLISGLEADQGTPIKLPKANQVERSLETLGLG